MRVTRIRYSERNKVNRTDTIYELNPDSLHPDDFKNFRDILDRSGILFYQTQNREISEGDGVLTLNVEALDGSHENISCVVALSVDHLELADFVKRLGSKASRSGKKAEVS